MAVPLKSLSIVENWDCHNCGHCCRGTVVILDRNDLEQIQSQQWHQHAEFQGKPIVRRESLLGGKQVLARKPDGSCVFLTDERRCRIHEEFGESAKPSVCRMFPLQLVPLEKHINVTLRFACPSAVIGKGAPLQEKIGELRQSDLVGRFSSEGMKAPRIARYGKRSWQDFLHVADVLQQLTTDERTPMVRRLAHGLRFCSLLDSCRLSKLDDKGFRELIEILTASATESVSELFSERAAPGKMTGILFRQSAVHFIRSHPTYSLANSVYDRLRLLLASMRFACGGRTIPVLHPEFAAREFMELDRPLGPLAPALVQPLNRYFESNACSLQYAIGNQHRSLVRSYRTLVFGFPMALWMLRLVLGSGTPNLQEVVNIVSMLDRAQGSSAITSTANWLANAGKLEELVAWYAR